MILSSEICTKSAPCLGDDRVLGEHDRVRPVLGPGQLGKDDAGHAGGDDDADDTLDAHHQNGFRTSLSCLSSTIPVIIEHPLERCSKTLISESKSS